MKKSTCTSILYHVSDDSFRYIVINRFDKKDLIITFTSILFN